MTVYLVGAGPGDPGLITRRGAEVLERADLVVYDRLSVRSLLDLAPSGAERINVGKQPGRPTLPQDGINALLVERGRAGATVVRLKGGDPFVFARGGEEAAALQAAGVPYEVVPGISSAIAAPAYAGIPLTMRHSSELFTVITGHEDPDKGGELDWSTIAALGGTIVVLMGVARLPKIVARLLDGGLDPATPVAAVRWGTRPEQRTTRATLGTLLEHLDELRSPSVIVIGRVAAMNLDWFESRPLFGSTIVVTRAREQASTLVTQLRDQGAEVLEVPTIRIVDPDDGGTALRDAAATVRSYDWVVLTSVNGVERLLAHLHDARALGGVQVAAIGPGTAQALRAHGIVADLVPARAVGEELLAAFPDPPATGARVLLARAAVARDVVPDGLRAKGWTVDVVEAYATVPADVDTVDQDAIATADLITFTSASTVDRFVEAFGAGPVPPRVACIGPVTAAAARAHGLAVAIEASTHTVAGLVEAVVAGVAAAPATPRAAPGTQDPAPDPAG